MLCGFGQPLEAEGKIGSAGTFTLHHCGQKKGNCQEKDFLYNLEFGTLIIDFTLVLVLRLGLMFFRLAFGFLSSFILFSFLVAKLFVWWVAFLKERNYVEVGPMGFRCRLNIGGPGGNDFRRYLLN